MAIARSIGWVNRLAPPADPSPNSPAFGEAEMTLDEFLDQTFTYLRTGC